MDDAITQRITELVEHEHRLRAHHESGAASDDDRSRLAALEVELDQCWDLLRQRRARRKAHQDEATTDVRSADTVEGYQQ